MPGEEKEAGTVRGLRYDELSDPEFQKRWIEARKLSWEQVERAFRHGFDSRGRFADRPYREVSHYLRESWESMAPGVGWDQVADIVRSGYGRYTGAGFGESAELGPEARDHFPQVTSGGSALGGTMGERPHLGAAQPVSDFEGEGGPPVGGIGGSPGRAKRSDD